MAVNVKMGVDIGGFTAGIREGQQILKGLNAEMKATDAEFKATGNAEQKMAQQTKTLNSQLNVQRGIFDQAQKALKKMEEAGIKPTDAAYQKMYATMMNAKAGMSDAQAQLNQLGSDAETAAGKADKLTASMNGLNRKVSLEQVLSGVNAITGGLENAARMAVNLGEQLWNTIMDSARRADDTATMAQMYGIDLDKFLQMQRLVTDGMDTSVDSMLSAQDKLKKGVGKGSTEVLDYLKELHVGMREGVLEDWASWKQKDPDKMFWEVGQALLNLDDTFKQEAMATTLFGKSWKDLMSLFQTYKSKEEYEEALAGVTTNSEETIRDLAALNDAVSSLEGSWTILKDEMLGAIAPALKSGADALSTLLDSLTEYLKTDEGQKMLSDLGTAVSGLFDDLTKIDPQKVVEGFTGVLNTVVDSVKWLSENSTTVIDALESIVIGWGALKLTGGVLEIVKLISGLQGLVGGTAAIEAAGTAAGTAFATSFTAGFVAAAPVVASILGIVAGATAPAIAAGKADEVRWMKKYTDRIQAAMNAGDNGGFVESAAETIGTKGQIRMDAAYDLLMGLSGRQNQQKAELYNVLKNAAPTNGYDTWGLLNAFWGGAELDPGQVDALLQNVTDALAGLTETKKPEIPVQLEVPDTIAGDIEAQVPPIELPAQLVINGWSFGWGMGGGGTGGAGVNRPTARANGLPYVPYDGYLAALHKGERVVPAREISSRNYSSNLYVENMNMNGGASAEGLAAAMAAAQRRTMSAYGS